MVLKLRLNANALENIIGTVREFVERGQMYTEDIVDCERILGGESLDKIGKLTFADIRTTHDKRLSCCPTRPAAA